ncbi:lycopene cyclase family protein [Rhodococcus sp. IEGM 1379]|uniref:lycopene cyclase family protein n=1 Tax=Rhodococcus sp. IEGM 1379 TaxID=3047086 RepID=UPI0024B72D7B|nr:lycopene cyclase family protein [Rhodococcus sp. IEGM 1379]MDI9918859.1 lycopene cyclase family protein [Rhodococcus sp. IEGM 1379]
MTSRIQTADVVIVGGGPAGRALATRCITHDLSVILVDPHPSRTWTATYAAWEDELPAWLPSEVASTRIERPSVWAEGATTLNRTYCVLNTSLLQSLLSDSSLQFIATKAIHLTRDSVFCADGTHVVGSVVVDARGTTITPRSAQQTAFGIVVNRATAEPALDGNDAWFMDWRQDNGTHAGDQPSFLYAVPLDSERMLLEETCLVGRPPIPLSELKRRLHIRLDNRGAIAPEDSAVERVRFSVEPPPGQRGTIFRFGARGGLTHPGTGYSVGAALNEADLAASAIAHGGDPQRELWPYSARGVAALRRVGLNALLTLDPDDVEAFFAKFFALPADQQRAYLSDRRDAAATAKVMVSIMASSPRRVRKTLMAAPFRRTNPVDQD